MKTKRIKTHSTSRMSGSSGMALHFCVTHMLTICTAIRQAERDDVVKCVPANGRRTFAPAILDRHKTMIIALLLSLLRTSVELKSFSVSVALSLPVPSFSCLPLVNGTESSPGHFTGSEMRKTRIFRFLTLRCPGETRNLVHSHTRSGHYRRAPNVGDPQRWQ